MKAINKLIKSKKGFTLVELIVVIAVLGILAGIAVPRITGVQDKAHYAAGEALLANLKTPLELYRVEEGNYPDEDNYDGLKDELEEDGYIDNFSSMLPENDEENDWYFDSYSYNENDDRYTLTISHPDVDDNLQLTPDEGVSKNGG
ncbi:MAG: type IV pilin protein [Halanaerobiales bacterium]